MSLGGRRGADAGRRRLLGGVASSAMLLSLLPGTAGVIASSHRSSVRQPAQSTVVAHGVRLSVATSKNAYPRDALIRTSIRLDNLSQHVVKLALQCSSGFLEAQAVSRSGGVRYPPLFKEGYGPALPCKIGTPPRAVPPGHSIIRTQYVILRTHRLRAVADLGRVGMPLLVMTPPLVLRFTPSTPPLASLISAPRLKAKIVPSTSGQRGPLLYQESVLCGSGSSGLVTGGSVTTSWHRRFARRSYLFYPSCSVPLQWHIVAGWVNQPVALIDYPNP
jgi:hypothetical protein